MTANEQPVWDDEQSAGSLFPLARPHPRPRVAWDGISGQVPGNFIHEMRASDDARLAARDALRQQGEAEEGREEQWMKVRESARFDIRRERRLERIKAGIEKGPTGLGEVTIGLHFDASAFDDFSAAVAKMGKQINAILAIPPALMRPPKPSSAMHAGQMDALAYAVSAMARANSPLQSAIKATAKAQEDEVRKQAMAWTPPLTRDAAQRAARDFDALTTSIAPKPPPRERYLPGTRHAGKNGKRR